MQQATQIELVQRLQAYLDNNTTGMGTGVHTNNIQTYLSEAQFKQEQQTLFRNYPILVCYSSQVARPGDYFTHHETGVPILVTRARDGKVRAFMNVCSHRRAKVATERCGHTTSVLHCPYHAWAFDLEGKLVSMPDEFGFDTLNKQDLGLVELPAAEAYGTVWVRPSPGEAVDMGKFLGPIHDELSNFGTERWVHFRTIEMRKKMNWKLMVDAFLEFYHFRFLHQSSIGPLFLNNITAFDPFDAHARIIGANKTIRQLEPGKEQEWRLQDHALVLYMIFPNTAFIHVKDHVITLTVFPDEGRIDRAMVRMSFLIPEAPASASAEQHWGTQADLLEQVTEEDFEMGEDIQAGLAAGGQQEVYYGKVEPALHHYHSTIRRELGITMPAAARSA